MIFTLLKIFYRMFEGLILRRLRTSYYRNFSKSKENLDVSGKTILITGAASGFGKQFAEDFLSFGKRAPKRLILWDVHPDINKLYVDKATSVTEIETCQLDTTDYEKVSAEIQKIKNRKDGAAVNICICNAGISARKTFDQMDFPTYQKTIDVNFMSKVFLTKQVLDSFGQQVDRLIYISSVAGYCPGAVMTEYSPSKHAIRVFAESLEKEISGKKGHKNSNCKFSVICPYFAPTKITVYAEDNPIRMSGWKRIPFKISVQDVSDALMDAIYYDFGTLVVGRISLVFKFWYYIFGPRHGLEAVLGR